MAAEDQNIGTRIEDEPMGEPKIADFFLLVGYAPSRFEAQIDPIDQGVVVEALRGKLNGLFLTYVWLFRVNGYFWIAFSSTDSFCFW